LCEGTLLSLSVQDGVQLAHRLFVGLAALAVLNLVLRAWRFHRSDTLVLTLATASGVLFVAQGLVGALQVLEGDGLYLRVLHTGTGALVWVVLVGLALHQGMASQAEPEAISRLNQARSWRDYVALTKPLIVGLLLFTTYSGMVVARGGLPPLDLTAWTLLGGALAAGGSGAINQYIDRRLDRMMVRTARRPIAAGRLTPAEGLAFGVALCLAAFFLLALNVNLAAALLSVVGMLYYVVLYSLLLKNTTVQNIVIGGGAGAIPPLVGWAAVTGGLTLPSLLLFAVIFFWTPPHFWALALVRRKDYQRAGVPMLPVVRGERETRRQVWVYTLVLVALTLILPAAGIGGWVYFVSALGLGGLLARAAWQVYRQAGNKLAWRMYRYSSMYLAFLFLALMVDTLV
jgi:protoheme IX farnesyltransferase